MCIRDSNKIENVAVSTAYLTAYRRDKEFEYVTVYLNARLTDYEINEETGQVLRGDPNARYELRYTLRFARNAGIKTTSANKMCIRDRYNAKKILNIALAGHGGCGKTSVAESMIYLAKASRCV